MSKKETDDFAKWQAEFASEFQDPEAQAAWQTLSTKAQDVVLDKLYRGTLRQSEFNRRVNETQAEKQAAAAARQQAEALVQESHNWYNMTKPEYEAAVKRAEVLQAVVEQAGLLAPAPARQPQQEQVAVDSQTAQELAALKQQLQGLNQGIPNFMRDLTKVQHEIIKGGYSVDPTAVYDYSNTRGVTLSQAFAELTADERKEREEAAIQKRVDDALAEQRRTLMSQAGTPDFVRSGPRNNLVEQLKNENSEMLDPGRVDLRRSAIMNAVREGLTA